MNVGDIIDEVKMNSMATVKGHVKCQLFVAETGEEDFVIEGENLFFSEILKSYMMAASLVKISGNSFGMSPMNAMQAKFENRRLSFIENASYITEVLWARMAVSNDTRDPIENEVVGGDILAFASLCESYSGSNDFVGNINLSESYVDSAENKCIIVVDFPTNAGNVTFQSVLLLNKSAYSGDNFATYPSCGFGAPLLPFKNAVGIVDESVLGAVLSPTAGNSNSYGRMEVRLPDGRVLCKDNGTSTSICYELDVDTGVLTAGQTIKRLSGDDTNFCYATVKGTKMYSMPSLTSKVVMIHETTNIYGNAETEYDLAALFPGNYNCAVVPHPTIANRLFVHFADYSNNDPITGDLYTKYIYEVDLSTMAILRRIRHGLYGGYTVVSFMRLLPMYFDSSDPSKLIFGYQKSPLTASLPFLRDNGTRILTCYGTTDRYEDAMIAVLDVDSEVLCGVGKMPGYGDHTLSKYDYTKLAKQKVFYDAKENCYIAYDYAGTLFTRLFHVGNLQPVNRVVLPAPVTKTNLKTMKLTYTLTIDPANFSIT